MAMAPKQNANSGKEPLVTAHLLMVILRRPALFYSVMMIDRSVTEAVHYAHAADHALGRIATQNSANPELLDALSEGAKFAAHRQN